MPNNICRLFLANLLLLGVVAMAAAQSGTKLRYGFAAGQKISVMQTETSQDNEENLVEKKKSTTSTSKEINQSWEIKSFSPTGDAAINVQYTSVRIRTSPAPGI